MACLYVTHEHLRELFGAVEERLADYIATIAGATVSRHMANISAGTPGRAKVRLDPPRGRVMIMSMPGAVPCGLAIGRLPRGNMAWTVFRSGIAL